MAEFRPAFEKTMELEGGFILHKVAGDTGGLTFAGIAENHWPNWSGWPIVKESGAEDPRLTPLVMEFYKTNFWNRIKGDELQEQETAENIFDFAVNAGVKTSAMIAQRIAGVLVDGVIGNKSIAALNQISGDDFAMAMFAFKIKRYARIVTRNRSQKKFLLGWINRSLKTLES